MNVTSDIQNKGCGVAQNKVRRSSELGCGVALASKTAGPGSIPGSAPLWRSLCSEIGPNDCDFYVIICMSQSIEIKINLKERHHATKPLKTSDKDNLDCKWINRNITWVRLKLKKFRIVGFRKNPN